MHGFSSRRTRDQAALPWNDDQIVDALEVSRSTVERVRTRCVEEGPDAALRPRPSPTSPLRKLDGAQEARLIAVACNPPPEGRKRWTLRLLATKWSNWTLSMPSHTKRCGAR